MKLLSVLLAFYIGMLSCLSVIEQLADVHLSCCSVQTESSCSVKGCTAEHPPADASDHEEKPCNPFHCVKCPVNILVEIPQFSFAVLYQDNEAILPSDINLNDMHLDDIWHPPI